MEKHTAAKKEIFLDYILSIILELVVLFGLIFFCALFIDKGPLIGEEKMIAGEMTSPTLGRFIYFILSFVLFLILGISASAYARRGKDVPAFWLGFASGILLWQSVGEEAWHFSVGGINFARIESVTSFPLVILFILLIIYECRHRSLDWGTEIVIASFACNWLGHYVTIGVYPFIEELIEAHTWNVLSGSICGILIFIFSIFYLIRHKDTKRGRMFASVLTYISFGVVSLSIFA